MLMKEVKGDKFVGRRAEVTTWKTTATRRSATGVRPERCCRDVLCAQRGVPYPDLDAQPQPGSAVPLLPPGGEPAQRVTDEHRGPL